MTGTAYRPNFLDQQNYEHYRRGRNERAVLAWILGAIIGGAVGVAIHLALAMHSDAIHARAMATLREGAQLKLNAKSSELAECQRIAEDFALAPYEQVRDLRRGVDAAQGRAEWKRHIPRYLVVGDKTLELQDDVAARR